MRLYRFLGQNLFAPPYRLLPLAVFVYIALSFFYHPQSPFHTFRLSDPDDYMHLNEVINWLQRQNWYDLSQPRLSPGAHIILHWSRLVDLPIALIAGPLFKAFGAMGAAMTAALVVPIILLVLLLTLLPALAEPLVGEERANLAALLALFAPMMLFNFTPGRVDHHNWEILIAGFGLFGLERMAYDKNGWRFCVLTAFTSACGLWIGTEALPWLILLIACLAIAGAWYGGYILRHAALFGAALAFTTACFLPIALPYNEWHRLAMSWFSLADVIFTALAGGMLVLGWALGQLTKKRWLRLGLMAALSLFAVTLFLHFVPQALNGPFTDYDDFNSTTALDNIAEATPLSAAFHFNPYNHLTYTRALMVFIRFLFLPLIALTIIGWQLRHARVKERMVWSFHGAFLLTAILLSVFWQVRIAWFMQMFAIAPLVWLLFAWWKKISHEIKGRTRFWAEIGVFLVLGPLPVLLVPAVTSGMNLYPDFLLFPAAHGVDDACNLTRAAEFIGSPRHRYVYFPITILAGANEGPELLFRTPANVIAANFDVPANRDVFDFFNARDDKAAIAVLRKWHADLVLTCRNVPPFYAGLDHPEAGKNVFLRQGADGKLHLTSSLDHPTLIEKLVNNQIPQWLKPVEIPEAKDYLLFEVKLPPAKTKP